MAQARIQYSFWHSIDWPKALEDPVVLLDDWIMTVVCELSIPLTIARFRRSKKAKNHGFEIRLATISTKKEVRAIRGLSYADQIPPLIINTPHFREKVLDRAFEIADSGYLNNEYAADILHIPKKEIEVVLQAIHGLNPGALILHDADSIVTLDYEKPTAE